MSNKQQLTSGQKNKPQHNVMKDNMKDALTSGDLVNIYFNQFMVVTSGSDVAIVVQRNGKNEAVLNLSHVIAKALAESLTKSISDFEQATNQEIIVNGSLNSSRE